MEADTCSGGGLSLQAAACLLGNHPHKLLICGFQCLKAASTICWMQLCSKYKKKSDQLIDLTGC